MPPSNRSTVPTRICLRKSSARPPEALSLSRLSRPNAFRLSSRSGPRFLTFLARVAQLALHRVEFGAQELPIQRQHVHEIAGVPPRPDPISPNDESEGLRSGLQLPPSVPAGRPCDLNIRAEPHARPNQRVAPVGEFSASTPRFPFTLGPTEAAASSHTPHDLLPHKRGYSKASLLSFQASQLPSLLGPSASGSEPVSARPLLRRSRM